MYNVNLRVAKYGRCEWTKYGIDYCKQYIPVSLKDMTAPPEFLPAQMNCVGIDKAVLQRARVHGKLANYYREAIEEWPDRFIGLTQVDEARVYTQDQIAELHRGIGKLGLSGSYFEPGAVFMDNLKHNFDDGIFGPFWEEIDSLAILVYVQMDRSQYLDNSKKMGKYP